MIETENTPNPDTLKFIPGKKVSEIGPIEFIKNEKSITVPLASKILSLDGTLMVFFGEDFITVKKDPNLNWEDLKHSIMSEINDYYSKGNDIIVKKSSIKNKIHAKPDKSNEIINKINEVLDTKVRPAVAKDGGDIQFVSFKDGVVKVALKGSCSGCPSSVMTLKQGVQNLLCHYISEVKSVEAS
ncbi:MAG: Fe-S cluster biogenesis protein NfuA, 4Fe-4S-binding domain [Pelagibacterales bacterium]|nr:Fe-S cluster biogenesis protein NfuA, 4Fe-4S-binding domain [Pelagibacterales bacterium]